jgi:hypothetical protein
MKIRQQLHVIVAVVLLSLKLALAVNAVIADALPYMQINNGNTISVTRGERPQIVVQFGNRGNVTLEDVALSCTLGSANLSFTGEVYTNGAFPGYTIAGNQIHFPAIDIAPGQNYNAAFGVLASNFGDIKCFFFTEGHLLSETGTFITIH